MKTPSTCLLLALTLMTAPTAYAERTPCPPQPPWTAPAIVEGARATAAEMIQAQKEVLAYVRGIEHWNNCNEYIFGLQSKRMLRRAQDVAASYNRQLHRFRAASAKATTKR